MDGMAIIRPTPSIVTVAVIPSFVPNMSLVCRWTSPADRVHTILGAVLTGSHQP